MGIGMRAVLVVVMGLAWALGGPSGARVAAGGDPSPQLTVRGHPFSSLVRTQPTAPFVAFQPGVLGQNAEQEPPAKNTNGGSKLRRNILIYGAAFGGAGLFMAMQRCGNEGGSVCPIWAHWGSIGFGVGAGIGALVSSW